MKYKVGDVVKVKSPKWYEENRNLNGDILVDCPCTIGHGVAFTNKMAQKYCGKQFKVKRIEDERYFLDDSNIKFIDEFIEKRIPKEVVEEAILVYKTASVDFKAVLEETFGKELFIEDIREKVTNAFQASEIYCKNNDLAPMEWLHLSEIHITNVMAYADALVIAEALNEGWAPNWSDLSEDKFVVYNNMGEYGVAILKSDRYLDICFKSKELAEYFIKQFPDICKILYGGTK